MNTEAGIWVTILYLLRQHDEHNSSINLAVSSDLDTLNEWKKFLDRQDNASPAKRNGHYFVVEEIVNIPSGAKPSITEIRDLLGLSGQE